MQLSVLYVTIGLPILLAGHYLYLEQDSKIFFYGILAFNALIAGRAFAIQRERSNRRGFGITHLAFALFFSLAISTAHHEWAGFGLYGPQQKALLGAILWLLPSLSLPLLCPNLASISSFFIFLERGLALVAGSVLLSAALAQVGIGFGEVLFFADSDASRTFGPLGDQVGFACSLGLLLGFTRGAFSLVSLHGIAIALTGTRGAFIVSVIGGLIFSLSLIWSNRRERGRYALYLILGVAILALILLYTSAGEMILARLTHGEALEATMTPRLLAMELATEIIRENILWGLGFGGFYYEAIDRGAHLIFSNFVDNHVSNSTNQFLEMMVSGGVIGFSIYLLFLWKGARTISKASSSLPPELQLHFKGAFIWFMGMIIGNQAATWIQIYNLTGVYFILLAVLSERALTLYRRSLPANLVATCHPPTLPIAGLSPLQRRKS